MTRRPGRSPAPCPGPARSGGGPGPSPARAGSGRGAGCRSGRRSGGPSVSPGSENASVSSTRGVQRLRARPMKSIRDVRKPSGAASEARRPMAFACLSQASTACRPLDVLHLGEEPVVLRVAPVGLGAIEDPLQVRHDLDRVAGVLDRFSTVIVQSSTGSPASGRVISTVVRMPAGDVADLQALPSPLEARAVGELAPGSCRRPARRAADVRGSGGVDQEERPAGRVEEVVRAPADVVAAVAESG